MQSITFHQAPIGGRLVYKGFINNSVTEVTVEVPLRAVDSA